MTHALTPALRAGDEVRILTGMASGRIGLVTYADLVTGALQVEVELPVLLTRPDGPTAVSTLPYAPVELERATAVPVDVVASMSCPCGFAVALRPGHTPTERADFDQARASHIRDCSEGWTVTEGTAA